MITVPTNPVPPPGYLPDDGRRARDTLELAHQIASAWASLAALRGFPDRDRRVAVLKPFAF